MSALMAPVLPARAGPRAWRDQAPVSVERAAQHRPAARAGGGQLTGGLEAGWARLLPAGRSFLPAVSDPRCVLQAPETLPEREDLKVKPFTQGF